LLLQFDQRGVGLVRDEFTQTLLLFIVQARRPSATARTRLQASSFGEQLAHVFDPSNADPKHPRDLSQGILSGFVYVQDPLPEIDRIGGCHGVDSIPLV
jgi:hypothetical protein